MVHHGKGFGVDLYNVEMMANKLLPEVADAFGDAVGNCNNVAMGLNTGMFSSHLADSPSSTAYVGLHQAVTDLLSETQTSVKLTANALNEARQRYADDDGAAKAEMDRKWAHFRQTGGN